MLLKDVKVLILDDEPAVLEQSRIAVANFVSEGNIICSSSAIETMRIIETQPVDLVFIDVEMPDTNGFSVADYIASVNSKIKYVFLTGHSELAAQSYDYEPLDFLSKPIDILRLRKTFERYEASFVNKDFSKERIAVDTSAGFVLLSPSEISYISKENRKTLIHCTNKTYSVQYSLDEMEMIFRNFGLLRVHQSYLAPLARIVSVMPADFGKTYWAKLKDGNKVPVSQKRYPQLREHLSSRGIRFL